MDVEALLNRIQLKILEHEAAEIHLRDGWQMELLSSPLNNTLLQKHRLWDSQVKGKATVIMTFWAFEQ